MSDNENENKTNLDPDVLGGSTASFNFDFSEIEKPIPSSETENDEDTEVTPKETNTTEETKSLNDKLEDALKDDKTTQPKKRKTNKSKESKVNSVAEEESGFTIDDNVIIDKNPPKQSGILINNEEELNKTDDTSTSNTTPVKNEEKSYENTSKEENTKSEVEEEKKEEPKVILESEIAKKNDDPREDFEDIESEREKRDSEEIKSLSEQLEKLQDEMNDLVVEIEEENKKSVGSDVVIDKGNKIETAKSEKEKKLEEMSKTYMELYKSYADKVGKFNLCGATIEGSFGPALSSENPVLKKLSTVKLQSKDFTKTTPNDANNKDLFLEQYIDAVSASSPVMGHRITRVPCLLSGYYAEISTFTFGEMADFVRKSNEPNKTFRFKFMDELVALHSHVVWTSYLKKGEMSNLDDFLAKTKLQDLNQIYYGVYDASFPGTTTYNITCAKCGEQFQVEKTNKQLCYYLQNRGDTVLSDAFIHDVLLQKKSVDELRNTVVYQIANTLYEDKVIYPNNIKVSYGTPSVLDALETCAVIEDNFSDSYPDSSAMMDPTKDHHTIFLLFASIKKLIVPLNAGNDEGGKMIIRLYEISTLVDNGDERMEARKNIIKVLQGLPEEQFATLFEGKEVARRTNVKGIQHVIPEVVCENCKSYIGTLRLNMRDTFFMHTTETVSGLISAT